jgi:hypothetical protein
LSIEIKVSGTQHNQTYWCRKLAYDNSSCTVVLKKIKLTVDKSFEIIDDVVLLGLGVV